MTRPKHDAFAPRPPVEFTFNKCKLPECGQDGMCQGQALHHVLPDIPVADVQDLILELVTIGKVNLLALLLAPNLNQIVGLLLQVDGYPDRWVARHVDVRKLVELVTKAWEHDELQMVWDSMWPVIRDRLWPAAKEQLDGYLNRTAGSIYSGIRADLDARIASAGDSSTAT